MHVGLILPITIYTYTWFSERVYTQYIYVGIYTIYICILFSERTLFLQKPSLTAQPPQNTEICMQSLILFPNRLLPYYEDTCYLSRLYCTLLIWYPIIFYTWRIYFLWLYLLLLWLKACLNGNWAWQSIRASLGLTTRAEPNSMDCTLLFKKNPRPFRAFGTLNLTFGARRPCWPVLDSININSKSVNLVAHHIREKHIWHTFRGENPSNCTGCTILSVARSCSSTWLAHFAKWNSSNGKQIFYVYTAIFT